MKKICSNLFAVLCLMMGTMMMFSCSKSEDTPNEKGNPEAQVKVKEETKSAIISVKNLPAKSEVLLVYADDRGQMLTKGLTDAQGNWQFDADQLVGFEQHLKVMVKENNQNKLIQTLTIPAAKQTLTQQQIENLLMKHTWNSVVYTSRMLIKHKGNLPLDMFIGVAQKQFKFENNGKFIFKVTSPLNFTDNNGSWSLSNQQLNIKTKIPLGPLEIKNIRINKLTDDELLLLAEISDGLFLIGFKPLS